MISSRGLPLQADVVVDKVPELPIREAPKGKVGSVCLMVEMRCTSRRSWSRWVVVAKRGFSVAVHCTLDPALREHFLYTVSRGRHRFESSD